jgi:acyl-CoA synthetase (AMP-forming)/AMP-acid ligase II
LPTIHGLSDAADAAARRRLRLPGELATQASTKLHTLVTLTRAGVVHPERPDHLWNTARALLRYGTTPAAGYAANARNHPDAPAVIDELGTLSFKEVHERSNALAPALKEDGLEAGDAVAIMCRNHRGWVDAMVACSKLGANALFLNTAFSGPQLADVTKREKPKAVIFDHEFADVLKDAGRRRKRYVAWHEPDDGARGRDPMLEDVIAGGDPSDLDAPSQQGRAIILTSGTTGTPKGASRSMPKTIDPIAALLAVIPLRSREKTMIAAPLFHAWGFAQWALGISLASTVVLKRRFEEEATLSLTAQHECSALVVVPVMIQRILELDDEVLDRYDLSKVRAVPVSGSALRARCRTAGWTTSARTSTTSTARPRSRGRRSPRRATCARRRARPDGRRAEAS